MDKFVYFSKHHNRKIVIEPPRQRTIDDLSPVFRKVYIAIHNEYKVKYPHLFGTLDENNNDTNEKEKDVSLSCKDMCLANIEAASELSSSKNKRKVQNAEGDSLKIKKRSILSSIPEQNNPAPSTFKKENSPKLVEQAPSKIESNLQNQINEALVDYKISDASIVPHLNVNNKKGKFKIHENIIIKPAGSPKSNPNKNTNFISNLQKISFGPRSKDIENDQSISSPTFGISKRASYLGTQNFFEPQRCKIDHNETFYSINEKISSISQAKNHISIIEDSFELQNYLTPENFIQNQNPLKYLSQEKYTYIQEWCNPQLFDNEEDKENNHNLQNLAPVLEPRLDNSNTEKVYKKGKPKIIKKGFYNIEIDKCNKKGNQKRKKFIFRQIKITDMLKPVPKKEEA